MTKGGEKEEEKKDRALFRMYVNAKEKPTKIIANNWLDEQNKKKKVRQC